MSDDTPILPPHIEETVRAIARLHAEHYARATPLQKFLDTMTARAGRPSFIPIVTLVVVAWIALNVIQKLLRLHPVDDPPFGWLQGAIALAALYMTALILTTQRREDQLASHREQLTLELGILSEQKAAKIIELLEELRRDNPLIPDRIDEEAEALSAPADPGAVLEAIRDTQEDDALLKGEPGFEVDQEEEVLGGVAGQARDAVDGVAHEAIERGKHVAQAVADAEKKSAQEHGLSGGKA